MGVGGWASIDEDGTYFYLGYTRDADGNVVVTMRGSEGSPEDQYQPFPQGANGLEDLSQPLLRREVLPSPAVLALQPLSFEVELASKRHLFVYYGVSDCEAKAAAAEKIFTEEDGLR
jgi:hypothetical protein